MTSRLRSFISSIVYRSSPAKYQTRLHEMKRRVSGRSHQVVYFHQIDDPYSHLLVQALARVQSSYDIDLELRIVPAPADDAAPSASRWKIIRAAMRRQSRRFTICNLTIRAVSQQQKSASLPNALW